MEPWGFGSLKRPPILNSCSPGPGEDPFPSCDAATRSRRLIPILCGPQACVRARASPASPPSHGVVWWLASRLSRLSRLSRPAVLAKLAATQQPQAARCTPTPRHAVLGGLFNNTQAILEPCPPTLRDIHHLVEMDGSVSRRPVVFVRRRVPASQF